MKIVKLKGGGGIGNLMFQYTFAKLLQKRTGEEIYLDFTLKGEDVIKNFCLTLPQAKEKDIRNFCLFKHKGQLQTIRYYLEVIAEWKLNRKYYFERNRAYVDPSNILGYSYFDGYWISWRYFEEVRDEVLADFVPNYELSDNTKRTIETIDLQNAVFVGVRRGDYTKYASHFGSFDSVYYKRAMGYIAERVCNPIFYIFSNDIPWCKENLDWGNYHVIYREPEQQTSDFEELMIMGSCKHAIMVNSTYHWWGSTLIKNPQKIICCPDIWFFDGSPIDIIPPNWIQIPRQ